MKGRRCDEDFFIKIVLTVVNAKCKMQNAKLRGSYAFDCNDKVSVGAYLPSKAGGPPFYSVDVYDLFSSESIII